MIGDRSRAAVHDKRANASGILADPHVQHEFHIAPVFDNHSAGPAAPNLCPADIVYVTSGVSGGQAAPVGDDERGGAAAIGDCDLAAAGNALRTPPPAATRIGVALVGH